MEIDFTKMNGCGNDFVVIDARKHGLQGLELTQAQVQNIAKRDNFITKGCDQVLIIRPPKAGGTVFMEIRNADGQVEACGNGTRAVAAYLADNDNIQTGSIETVGGILEYITTQKMAGATPKQETEMQTFFALVTIMMPPPKFDWQHIPLKEAVNDITRVQLHPDLPLAFLVNLGNPHAVFFVTGETETFARQYGAVLEQHSLFPARANINFAWIEGYSSEETIDKYQIQLHTWERGVGLTKSCGTGACASTIACHHLFSKKLETSSTVKMSGGSLQVTYSTNKSFPMLAMDGEAEFEFEGKITLNDKVAI
ncbi:MAG: diaminopimelate epimerase [Alphaproteobacteria bacterium]|nr:diaminopimelate epimerase [Alphaproteobacteria bacterium]